jgi:hypothetical protein
MRGAKRRTRDNKHSLLERLCRNGEITEDVILNAVKNLDLSIGCRRRDPSASPQDDSTTQSLTERVEVRVIFLFPLTLILSRKGRGTLIQQVVFESRRL